MEEEKKLPKNWEFHGAVIPHPIFLSRNRNHDIFEKRVIQLLENFQTKSRELDGHVMEWDWETEYDHWGKKHRELNVDNRHNIDGYQIEYTLECRHRKLDLLKKELNTIILDNSRKYASQGLKIRQQKKNISSLRQRIAVETNWNKQMSEIENIVLGYHPREMVTRRILEDLCNSRLLGTKDTDEKNIIGDASLSPLSLNVMDNTRPLHPQEITASNIKEFIKADLSQTVPIQPTDAIIQLNKQMTSGKSIGNIKLLKNVEEQAIPEKGRKSSLSALTKTEKIDILLKSEIISKRNEKDMDKAKPSKQIGGIQQTLMDSSSVSSRRSSKISITSAQDKRQVTPNGSLQKQIEPKRRKSVFAPRNVPKLLSDTQLNDKSTVKPSTQINKASIKQHVIPITLPDRRPRVVSSNIKQSTTTTLPTIQSRSGSSLMKKIENDTPKAEQSLPLTDTKVLPSSSSDQLLKRPIQQHTDTKLSAKGLERLAERTDKINTYTRTTDSLINGTIKPSISQNISPHIQRTSDTTSHSTTIGLFPKSTDSISPSSSGITPPVKESDNKKISLPIITTTDNVTISTIVPKPSTEKTVKNEALSQKVEHVQLRSSKDFLKQDALLKDQQKLPISSQPIVSTLKSPKDKRTIISSPTTYNKPSEKVTESITPKSLQSSILQDETLIKKDVVSSPIKSALIVSKESQSSQTQLLQKKGTSFQEITLSSNESKTKPSDSPSKKFESNVLVSKSRSITPVATKSDTTQLSKTQETNKQLDRIQRAKIKQQLLSPSMMSPRQVEPQGKKLFQAPPSDISRHKLQSSVILPSRTKGKQSDIKASHIISLQGLDSKEQKTQVRSSLSMFHRSVSLPPEKPETGSQLSSVAKRLKSSKSFVASSKRVSQLQKTSPKEKKVYLESLRLLPGIRLTTASGALTDIVKAKDMTKRSKSRLSSPSTPKGSMIPNKKKN